MLLIQGVRTVKRFVYSTSRLLEQEINGNGSISHTLLRRLSSSLERYYLASFLYVLTATCRKAFSINTLTQRWRKDSQSASNVSGFS